MKQVDVVGAVILNAAGQVLCARRSPRMSQAGLWEFPGGKIEPGEEPRTTLKREIQEELLCDIQVGDLIANATHAYPTVVVRLRTYYATIIGGAPHPSEHDQLVWLPKAELNRLEWAPADLQTVSLLTGAAPP